jgi:hypothetical protein
MNALNYHLRGADLLDGKGQHVGDVVDVLERLTLDKAGVAAVEEDTSASMVGGQRIPQPHVLTASVLPRPERMAAEAAYSDEYSM